MFFEFLKKNNFLILYLIVIGVVNLFLQTIPLTNVFGYEFSAINSLLLSFISGIYTISYFKFSSKTKNFSNIGQLFEAWLWMLFVPLIISIVKSIIFGFCSFWDGLLFYLVITCPSVIIGSSMGAISFHFIKRFRVTLYVFIFLMILLILPLLEIYFNPQVYLYNPLFAYFPGTIYDEGISVDFKILLYRIFNLIFFLSILRYFVRWSRRENSFNKRLSFLILTFFISGAFYFFISPSLGYTTTESCLKHKLSTRIESENFIIHADKRIEKDELKLIVLNQEYYFQKLQIYFKENPSSKITSYIFFNAEQKKELFGAGNADVAKPWLNCIYISLDSWESTLKHEIAHCFTAEFGTGIFKLASGFNPALIEGVAEAADGFYDENSINYLASLAYQNNYRIDLNSLFSGFSFFGSVSSLSYIYSGSFIYYLISEFGIEKVKQFYRTNDFKSAFGIELSRVTDNYEKFLEKLEPDVNKEHANYYFGRKSLINKVCPRYVAASLQKAWDHYYSNDFYSAEIIFKEILFKDDNYSAIVGLAKIYEDADSIDMAIKLLNSFLKNFDGTSSEFDLKFRLAELYVKNSELTQASDLYSSLANNSSGRRMKLLAKTRLALNENGNIIKYVSGSDFDKYTILKELNSKKYFYPSIPLMIDLSLSLGEDYNGFLINFKNDFEVKDELSSYAILKLSEYMLRNFDYVNARKMAGFALRFKENENFVRLTEDNYKKSEWFFKFSKQILEQTKFSLN